MKMGSDQAIDEADIIDGLDINFFKFNKLWHILNYYRAKREISWILYVGIAITFALHVTFVSTQIICFFFVNLDLKEASLLILNPLSQTQSIIKILFFYINIKKQTALLDIYKKDFLPSINREKQQKVSHIYKKFVKKSNLLCLLPIIVNNTCVVFWNFLPVARSKMVEDYFNIKIPSEDGGPNKILGGWYPFPYTETPWYQMVYVYEFMACFWCGHLICLSEALIVSLVIMLGTHLKVLAYYIRKITEETKGNKENRIDVPPSERSNSKGINACDQLCLYIKDHQMVMKKGDDLKRLYNFLITLQLGLGILIMIISVFHFIFDSKSAVFTIKFLVYLTYQVTEIVLYCYCGTFIETASTDLAFATYEAEWFTMDAKYRKTSQMLMIRARAPISLIAVRLYPVNAQTLLSMMQFTYTTSALLSRLIE